MRGRKRRILALLAGVALLAPATALACCAVLWQGATAGRGSRSDMTEETASEACLGEVGALVEASDAEGLAAAFSDAARDQDPDLASEAEELMDVLGGGTLTDGDFGSSTKLFPSGDHHIMSIATVTAPDGTSWQVHVIDCTYNGDDPSQVGLRSVEAIPGTDWDAPQGFAWYGLDDAWPCGIRLITSWEGWVPEPNPYHANSQGS